MACQDDGRIYTVFRNTFKCNKTAHGNYNLVASAVSKLISLLSFCIRRFIIINKKSEEM
jgi:hypothetical protein